MFELGCYLKKKVRERAAFKNMYEFIFQEKGGVTLRFLVNCAPPIQKDNNYQNINCDLNSMFLRIHLYNF